MKQSFRSITRFTKKEKKESTLHKIQRRINQPTYIFTHKEIRVGIFLLLGCLVLLTPVYGYYRNVYLPSIHPSVNHNQDPFTTLWNGQIPNTFSSSNNPVFDFINGPPNAPSGILCSACTSPISTGTPSTVVSGEAIIVTIDTSGSPALTVTDSQSNTYTSYSNSVIDASGIETFTTLTSSSGSITWTITFTGTQSFVASFFGYKGVTSFSGFNSNTALVGNSGSTSLSPTVSSAFTFGHIQVIDRLGTSTLTSTGTIRQNFGLGTYTPNSRVGSDDSTTNTDSWTWGGSGSACNPNCATNQVVLSLVGNGIACEQVGYHCFNSVITNGNINLKSNSSTIGLAQSQSQIDLSTGVNKSITFGLLTAPDTNFAGEELAWFLTINGTTISNNSTLNNLSLGKYNPLNDSSVTLEVLEVWTSSTVVNYYVYMQRANNQILKITSLSDNPYPSGICPQSSTIFLCTLSSHGTGSAITSQSLGLNFTGNSNGTGNGVSYLCIDSGSGSSTCNLGGKNNVQINLANTNLILNYTQPWINIQEKYYIGFWFKCVCTTVGTFTSTFDASTTASTFSPVISLFTPNGSGKTNGQDFIGWLTSSLNTIGQIYTVNTCSIPLISNACQAPQSIESSFINAVLFLINTLAVSIRLFLNGLGKGLGVNGLGDEFINFLSGIGTWLSNVTSVAFGQLLNIGNQASSLINTVILFFTTGQYLTFITNFLANIALAIPLLNTVFGDALTLFTSFAQFTTFLFFIWWLWVGFEIYFRGHKGLMNEIKMMTEVLPMIFHAGYYFAKESWEIGLHIKQYITGWL